MQPLREEKDADRNEFGYTATPFPDGESQHPVICATCGDTFYTDKETQERVTRSISRGLDNPFECDDCISESEEFAYTGQ
jgi:hypothetical protein